MESLGPNEAKNEKKNLKNLNLKKFKIFFKFKRLKYSKKTI